MQFQSRNNLNSSLSKMSEPTLFPDLGHVACSTRVSACFFVFFSHAVVLQHLCADVADRMSGVGLGLSYSL